MGFIERLQFNCNDIESSLTACIAGYGIGRFTELNVRQALTAKQLQPILSDYDWGNYHLYALYSNKHLPLRTRLLLDVISATWELLPKSIPNHIEQNKITLV
jgi:LysR family transcriptional activator of dmlA